GVVIAVCSKQGYQAVVQPRGLRAAGHWNAWNDGKSKRARSGLYPDRYGLDPKVSSWGRPDTRVQGRSFQPAEPREPWNSADDTHGPVVRADSFGQRSSRYADGF